MRWVQDSEKYSSEGLQYAMKYLQRTIGMASLCTWSCGSFVSPSSNFLEDDKGGGIVGLELM